MNPKWLLSKDVAGREHSPITREADPNVDEDHLRWIRSLPCAVLAHPLPGATRCRFRIHAHHPTGAGIALKAPDQDAIPLCLGHHEERHRLCGAFAAFMHETIGAWETAMASLYRALGELRRRL